MEEYKHIPIFTLVVLSSLALTVVMITVVSLIESSPNWLRFTVAGSTVFLVAVLDVAHWWRTRHLPEKPDDE